MNFRDRHILRIRVVPEDIDELEHVNNTVYLRYIEQAVKAHAERVGMGFAVLKGLGVIPVVRRHVITYHRSALLGEELKVSTRITAFSGFRATRHNEVRRAGDQALLVEVETDWVWLDAERGRPKNVPQAVLEAFGLL